MRNWTPIMVVAALMVACGSWAQAPVDGAAMNRHVLADGESNEGWEIAECTMEPSDTQARSGKSLNFHVPVDHTAGEIKYPIGWPRTYLSIPEDQRDWSGHDFLEMWVYANTSREKLPGTAVGFTIACPDRSNSWHRTLTEVKKGEWARIVIPLTVCPDITNCASIKFHVSESSYEHGDMVEFYVDDVALLSYAEPTILELLPLTGLMYADASSLRVQARVTGLAADAPAEMNSVLKLGDKVLAEENLTVERGLQSLLMSFGAGSLKPGECTLTATITGSERVLTVPIRVVASPWE